MAGIWCLAPRKALVRLMAMVSVQPCADTPVVGPISPKVPALLNAMSSPPNRSVASATSDAASSSERTSPASATATPPAASISATTLASSASRRAASTTLAPSWANSLAVARPIPVLAPVTIATLPFKRCMSKSSALPAAPAVPLMDTTYDSA